MAIDTHHAQQEAKYRVPYHYLETPLSLNGLVYFSYLTVAREILLGRTPTRALDAGCGDGRFIAFVNAIAPMCQIEGLDVSEQALAFARIYNPAVTFTRADLAHPPYAPRTFDVITLIEIVEHIPPAALPAMLRVCRDLLAPNGALIITTPTTNERKMSKAHYQHFTRESMNAVLARAGLRAVSIEGNFRDSRLQWLLHGLLQNRLFEVRSQLVLAWYRTCFDKFWRSCPVERARRMIVVAEPFEP